MEETEMTATKRLSTVNHTPGWTLLVDGRPVDGDWEVTSERFGSVESAVVVDENGAPVFDRPLYREAQNVNLVVFGRTADENVRIAVIRQPRPHSDNPLDRESNDHDPVVFGQVPMGFAEKIIGESLDDTAIRETGEETGATVVKRVMRPKMPFHNPNPTFVATWSDLLFVEVDIERIEALKSSRNEPIFSAEFISAEELISRIAAGTDETGAYYRMATANSTLLIFFATFPSFWPDNEVWPQEN